MAHVSIGRTFVLDYHDNHRSAATKVWVAVTAECTS